MQYEKKNMQKNDNFDILDGFKGSIFNENRDPN